MKARVVKVKLNKSEWYEVQVRILGFLWIDANFYDSSFPSMYTNLEPAIASLDKLKKTKLKEVVYNTVL